jgi:phage shock protein C
MAKRLQRSRTERMIAGVCGGVAEYFEVDPTLVRLIWVAITVMAGAGILLYLIMWVIMPLEHPGPPR